LHQLSNDPSFYVQNACVTDPSLAPKKMSTLYVLLPVTHEHRNVNWDAEKACFRSLALRQLEKIGIADVEHRIHYEKVITPADWRTEYALHKGSTFSMATIWDRCSTCGRTTALRILTASTWSAAVRIPAAACR